MMLYRSKPIEEWREQQGRSEWKQIQGHDLNGQTCGIIGTGAIGGEVARLAKACGMHTIGVRRSGKAMRHIDEMLPASKLQALLKRSDFVVIATPLTPETRHLIDHAALGAMRSSARLVNVGRGEIIDDEALVEALRAGAIAGAGLDVFTVEPLPPEHPYWGLDAVIITPHVSGYLPDFFARALALFADNLERFQDGRPLRNLVDKRLGYAPDWSADPKGPA
jgi:phosphoglycerate dehydrogenase-like enzyme